MDWSYLKKTNVSCLWFTLFYWICIVFRQTYVRERSYVNLRLFLNRHKKKKKLKPKQKWV